MNRDLMICRRILLQFVQTGNFSTNDPTEAYHVALMVDRNYVEAKVSTNDAGTPIAAQIGRLTACGHDAVEAELATAMSQPQSSNQSDYYNILVRNQAENDQGRDKILLSVATGGIALLFAIASFYRSHEITLETVPWVITVSLWGTVLVGLLVSYHVGSTAARNAISSLNDPESDVRHQKTIYDLTTEKLNTYNCIAVIAGIVTFSWFILASIYRR